MSKESGQVGIYLDKISKLAKPQGGFFVTSI